LRPVRPPCRPARLRAQGRGGGDAAPPPRRPRALALMPLILVIGGIRSGKSEVAERLAAASGAPVCYLATGSADDPEMVERIARHRDRRPAGWRTVESDDPAGAAVAERETLLVDGIAPWLARLMREGGLWTDQVVASLGAEGRASYERAVAAVHAFARTAAARPGLTVVAAEESGLGLLLQGAGARRYLDLAGEALQALARPAERVLLVVAGRATHLGGDDPAAPLTADRVSGHVPAELRLHGDTMVRGGQLDFAVNVVPGGPPAWLRDELAAALDRAAAYPDEREAVAALADRHGRAPGEVLPTNGSAEAFWLLAGALRPARATVVHPSFTEPEAALRAAGHQIERAFRHPRDFELNPSAVPDGADLVVLGNPNNPSGTLDPAGVLAGPARPAAGGRRGLHGARARRAGEPRLPCGAARAGGRPEPDEDLVAGGRARRVPACARRHRRGRARRPSALERERAGVRGAGSLGEAILGLGWGGGGGDRPPGRGGARRAGRRPGWAARGASVALGRELPADPGAGRAGRPRRAQPARHRRAPGRHLPRPHQ